MIVANAATFPKTARVRKRPEFIQLASAQHKTTVTGFLVVWCENCNKTARLGITASKKIGNAVVRNRVKRYIREFFRHKRFELLSVDVNVIPRRECVNMSYSDFELQLNKAFRFIGISSCSRASCSS